MLLVGTEEEGLGGNKSGEEQRGDSGKDLHDGSGGGSEG